MKAHILNSPSLIEYKGQKFLIFDAPTDATLDNYLKVCIIWNNVFILDIVKNDRMSKERGSWSRLHIYSKTQPQTGF